jgi:NAD+ diphosphatase
LYTTRLYIFSGADLVVPELPEGQGVLEGVERKALPSEFSGGEYVAIPGIDDTGPIVFLTLAKDFPLPPGWEKIPIRKYLPPMIAGERSGPVNRLLRAYHIMQWRRDSAFCGSCGRPNGDHPEELARQCPSCGRMEFPRISPAIIILIINEKGQALLAHNRNFVPGIYSLIAGFNEAGEDLESTIVREVREEVNIEVDTIRYIASQPWPFPNSLMLGFTARYKSGTLTPDGKEIEDARWFNRNALPDLPGNGSVSRYLINLWLEGRL